VNRATVRDLALAGLDTAEPAAKAAAARAAHAAWREAREAGRPLDAGSAPLPDRPARPAAPELRAPRDMARRGPGSPAGRVALLHAIAHIELNAIDLHLDTAARFADADLPPGVAGDFLAAAADEARHFLALEACLEARGSFYGALPAHDGLWQSSMDTAHDLAARLAVVPMVLEARGLDVTPGMITVFETAGEADAAAALRMIAEEEVAHVAYGTKWFHYLCGREGSDPEPRFHALVNAHFRGALKPPFNHEGRAEAGLTQGYYMPLAGLNAAWAPGR
jgi:uncharacterized ferritin-like protein (DUF455 family)